jgi:general secretion pathway protein G
MTHPEVPTMSNTTPALAIQPTDAPVSAPTLSATHVLRASERGMTLVEIMIVLAIMASVMGIVGFFANGAITNSRIKEAEVQLGNIKQAVDSFWVMRQEYPDSLSQLADPPGGMAPILERLPEDPWGNEYQYTKENNGFKVFCMGPDGATGGGDDICGEGEECN